MREILFRGKRVDNGEWVFGNFIEDKWGDDNGNTIYAILQDRVAPDIAELWTPVRVIPETVGEYTGLTDKNGKKIFEGDIVKNSRDVGLLYYKEKNSAFTVKGWEYGYWLWHDKEDIEVIGNIHDNPELLEVEK